MSGPIIGIIGLGYVGFPLALAFGQKFETIGFDIDESRIKELGNQFDRTKEGDIDLLSSSKALTLSNDIDAIRKADIYIVTTPTPVDNANQPDLAAVINAAKIVGSVISKNDIVILESTVFPGVTEGEFAAAIELESGLRATTDFQLGYSSERVNPGDKLHRLQDIVKVVSATCATTLETIYNLYLHIIPAGVLKAESIKTAELSKLIENTQRDVNIAFMNEMYQLSDKLDLDFNSVLACAETKWNFLKFKPGLVGGHCVAVDPYYLVHSQKLNNVSATMTTSARQTNESMIDFVTQKFVKQLTRTGISFPLAKILIIGVSFKPNCPDIRNSKHAMVIENLIDYGIKPVIYDPVISGCFDDSFLFVDELPDDTFDGILLLVPHEDVIHELRSIGKKLVHEKSIFFSLDQKYADLFR